LGAADTVRDFLFVTDNVRGYLAAAGSPNVCGEVLQLGTGSGTSIGRVVELAGQILGRKLEISSDVNRQRPEKSEVRELVCSPDKALAMLNWKPRVDLESGLRQTIQWIDANRAEYRVGQYAI
jgi:nucleoside-diphosphate-sugar epimerase